MLGLIFWMYGGYAWLTNAVPARGEGRQALLVGGMAGYLVLAIAVPDAFAGTGLAFGIAYLAINLVHAFLYVRFAPEPSSAAMRGLAPANVLAALVVLAGGAIGGTAQAVAWTAAALYQWLWPRDIAGFEVGPAHFVERHGLLVIVAIGESVVAIGVGAGGRAIDLAAAALVTLALALCAGLWWAYFGRDDDERIERALTAAGGGERARMALAGFGYAHYVLLLGIVLAAVGIEAAVAHPGEPLPAARALALAGGVAVFLAGDAWFRAILGIGRTAWRAAAAVAVLVAIPAATQLSAAAGLGATTAIFAAVLALEAARSLQAA
jgi:low temperature requirement protein LtrA